MKNKLKIFITLLSVMASIFIANLAYGASSLNVTGGLIGYWPGIIGGLYNNNTPDFSGSRNYHAYMGGVSSINSKIGKGFYFGDKAYFLFIEELTNKMNLTDVFSAQMWLNADPNYADGVIFEKYNKNNILIRALYNDGQIALQYSDDCASAIEYSTVNHISTNEFVHVAIVWDIGQEPKIYFNNILQNLDYDSGIGVSVCTSTHALHLGNNENQNNAFIGHIDEFALWNKALTEDEINWLYNNGNGNSLPITYWNFEDTYKRDLVTNTATLPLYTPDFGTGELNLVAGPSFTAWDNGSDNTGKSPNSDHWNNAVNVAHWRVQFSTIGQNDITISSRQRGSNTGPRDFQIKYNEDIQTSIWKDVPDGELTVSSSSSFTNAGSSNRLLVPNNIANKNDVFIGWFISSEYNVQGGPSIGASGTNRIDDIMVTGDILVFDLNYIAGAGGTISGNSSQEIPYLFDGTSVTAVADTGYNFVGWSDGVTDNPRTDISVTSDITVTANFVADTFTLTYISGVNGTITGSTTQTVNFSEDGTPVTAIGNSGYKFVDWSDGVTDNPRTDKNVNGDINVTANFAKTSSGGGGGGSGGSSGGGGGVAGGVASYGSSDNTKKEEEKTTDLDKLHGSGEDLDKFDTDKDSNLKDEGHLTLYCLNNDELFVDFDDTKDHFAKYAIALLGETLSNNVLVTKGYEGKNDEKLFKPNQNITRAEFLKMTLLANCVDVLDVSDLNPVKIFKDVPLDTEEWYLNHIYSALEKGIVDGNEDGNFYPNRQITRAEATKILVNVQKLVNNSYVGKDYFVDVNKTDWFYNFVSAGFENKIIYGSEDKSGNSVFNPHNNITRGETALILSRIFKLRGYVDFTDKNARYFEYVNKTNSDLEIENDDIGNTGSDLDNAIDIIKDLTVSVVNATTSDPLIPLGIFLSLTGLIVATVKLKRRK